MKRFLICLMTLALLLSATVVMTSAADYEDDAAIWDNVQLNALYVQSNDGLYSDLSEDYFELWWEEEEGIDDAYFMPCTVNMRGFGMSPNGDYAYMGTLNGSELRGVVVYNTVTGVCTDFYYHQNKAADGTTTGFSFAKGIDADERGYVYVGFTYAPDQGIVHLGIAQQQSDGTLTDVSDTVVYQDPNGTPGAGAQLGINGVDVITIGDKTYCYVVVNYTYDALYCYDVTDPANPVLNSEFGTDGVIVFSDPGCSVVPDGKTVKELQYLDVDAEGTVWVVMEPNEGGAGVMCISPDGSECTAFYENIGGGNIYSIKLVGDFMLLGAKSGSDVFVADKSTGEQVASMACYGTDNMSYGDRVTRIEVRNDIVYVCNASNNTSADNAIYAGALTDDGLAYIQNVVKSLNGDFDQPDETEPENNGEETKAPDVEETQAPDNDETKAPDNDETNAPDAEETKAPDAEETKAPAAETEAPKSDDEGCASLIISSGSVLALLAAAFVVSKRK